MSNANVQKGGKLLKAIDEVEEKKQKALESVLSLSFAKKSGIIENRPLGYNFEPRFADLIINSLADIVITLCVKADKKAINRATLFEAFTPLMVSVKPEIEKIYSAIKSIGFSSRLFDAERKWKGAALEAFDDSIKGFEAIKREYLEDDDLYFLTGGKERRDFEGKMLQKIIKDCGLGKYGLNTLRDIYKEAATDTA